MHKSVSFMPLLKSINKFLEKANSNLAEKLDDEGFLNAKETADSIDELDEQIAVILVAETSYITAALAKADSIQDFLDNVWDVLKEADTVAEDLRIVFMELFEGQIPFLASAYIQSVDAESVVDTIRLRTVSWMQEYSEKLAGFMKLTSHEQISDILTKALADGKSVAEATQAILDSGIRNEYYRARRVALTEMLTAHSAAASEAYAQSPVVTARKWKHTGNYRIEPRQNHVAMNGTKAEDGKLYDLESPDGKDTYHPMYPRDPILPPSERINCHCIEQPVVDKDILGMTLEERQALQQKIIDEDDEAWKKKADADARAKADAWRAAHVKGE